MQAKVHLRPDFPEDDRTYCGIRPPWKERVGQMWETLVWRWESVMKTKPHQVTCEDCVYEYDKAQLLELANCDLGDEYDDYL